MPTGETFAAVAVPDPDRAAATPAEAAALLDLLLLPGLGVPGGRAAAAGCPGLVDANAIGQRRWALEWAVILRGPYHDPPPGWEEVDLST